MSEERLYTQAEVDALVTEARTYTRGHCRVCWGRPGDHKMYCKHYEGPVTHAWTHQHLNQTWGGVDWYCSCGRTVRVGGLFREEDDCNAVPTCPGEAETVR